MIPGISTDLITPEDLNSSLAPYLTAAIAASTYLTQANAASTYVPRTGGTITGNLVVQDLVVGGVDGPRLNRSGTTIRARSNDGLSDAAFSAGAITASGNVQAGNVFFFGGNGNAVCMRGVAIDTTCGDLNLSGTTALGLVDVGNGTILRQLRASSIAIGANTSSAKTASINYDGSIDVERIRQAGNTNQQIVPSGGVWFLDCTGGFRMRDPGSNFASRFQVDNAGNITASGNITSLSGTSGVNRSITLGDTQARIVVGSPPIDGLASNQIGGNAALVLMPRTDNAGASIIHRIRHSGGYADALTVGSSGNTPIITINGNITASGSVLTNRIESNGVNNEIVVQPASGSTSSGISLRTPGGQDVLRTLGIGNPRVHIGTVTDNGDRLQVGGNIAASGNINLTSGAVITSGALGAGTLTINNDGNNRWQFVDGEFTAAGIIRPTANNVRNLGTVSHRWATVFGVNGDFSGNITSSGEIVATNRFNTATNGFFNANSNDNQASYRINGNAVLSNVFPNLVVNANNSYTAVQVNGTVRAASTYNSLQSPRFVVTQAGGVACTQFAIETALGQAYQFVTGFADSGLQLFSKSINGGTYDTQIAKVGRTGNWEFAGSVVASSNIGFATARVEQPLTQSMALRTFESSLATWQEPWIGRATPTGPVIGFLGASPIGRQTLPAAATDPATTQALCNALRQLLINFGFAN